MSVRSDPCFDRYLVYNSFPEFCQGVFAPFASIRSTGLNSEEFAEKLLMEEKVAVAPGNAFGACGEGHVRCCYATSLSEIEEALERMRRFVERRG